MEVPFYFIAGNHDWRGNVYAQLQYTDEASTSGRWHYPDLWHHVKWSKKDFPSVHVVMLDTVILAGLTEDYSECLLRGAGRNDCLQKHIPNEPHNVNLAAEQKEWLEQLLLKPDVHGADFLIFAGHYPVYSVGQEGSTSYLEKWLRPILEKHNASAYLCGHDHTFESIIPEFQLDHRTKNTVQYHLVGGTHGCETGHPHMGTIPEGSLDYHGCTGGSLEQSDKKGGGFAQLKLTKNQADTKGTLQMIFRDYNGHDTHTAPAMYSRNSHTVKTAASRRRATQPDKLEL